MKIRSVFISLLMAAQSFAAQSESGATVLDTRQSRAVKEPAQVRFKVKSLGEGSLRLKVEDEGHILADAVLTPSTIDIPQSPQCALARAGEGYVLGYHGQDGSQAVLVFAGDGNMAVVKADNTCFSRKKSWGFKASGRIVNQTCGVFYKIVTDAAAFHNLGIFKACHAHMTQQYLFNQGVLHFGGADDIAAAQAYDGYLLLINRTGRPEQRAGIIDDYGVFLAEQGVELRGLRHRAHGVTHIEPMLRMHGSAIENHGAYETGPVSGTATMIENDRFFHASSIGTDLRLDSFSNSSEFSLDNASELFCDTPFDNRGLISCGGDLSLGSREKPKSLGTATSAGAVKAMVKDFLRQPELEELLRGAVFGARKCKMILNIDKHTDHYLNTITHHQVTDGHGFTHTTHTTETGYIWQQRTTEHTVQEFETDIPGGPAAHEAGRQAMAARADSMAALRAHLREKLRAMGAIRGNAAVITDALREALGESGMDAQDIAAILGDGGIASMVALLAAQGETPSAGLEALLGVIGGQPGALGIKLLGAARRTGTGVGTWIRHNPCRFTGMLRSSAAQGTGRGIGPDALRALLKPAHEEPVRELLRTTNHTDAPLKRPLTPRSRAAKIAQDKARGLARLVVHPGAVDALSLDVPEAAGDGARRGKQAWIALKTMARDHVVMDERILRPCNEHKTARTVYEDAVVHDFLWEEGIGLASGLLLRGAGSIACHAWQAGKSLFKGAKAALKPSSLGQALKNGSHIKTAPEQIQGSFVKPIRSGVHGSTKQEQVLLAKPKMVEHHVFNKFRGDSEKSQKYREFFKAHDIDIDAYAVSITESMHRCVIHKSGNNWTTHWKNWIDANPHASTKEVYQFAGTLMDRYGISGLPLKKYRS